MKQIKSVPKMGDSGQDVVKLQETLKAAGFYKYNVDGLFGSKTKQAVSAFQKSKKLPGSGEIGPKTLNFLGLEVVVISPVTGQLAITSNLKGKKETRIIHPTFRLILESKVFPGGKIPLCFIQKDVVECMKQIALGLESLNIREKGGNNKGTEVGYIQGTTGGYTAGGNGDAWCEDTMQVLIAFMEDYFQQESPVPTSAHVVTTFTGAKKVAGLTVAGLEEGGMFAGQYKPKTNGHTGFNLKVHDQFRVTTIEGNTGANSVNDGDGLFLKERDIRKISPLVILGTIRVYPYNKVPVAS